MPLLLRSCGMREILPAVDICQDISGFLNGIHTLYEKYYSGVMPHSLETDLVLRAARYHLTVSAIAQLNTLFPGSLYGIGGGTSSGVQPTLSCHPSSTSSSHGCASSRCHHPSLLHAPLLPLEPPRCRRMAAYSAA